MDQERAGDPQGSEGDSALWLVDETPGVDPDVDSDEMRARFRASAERREAQHELLRLRSRYWSGERLIEEARSETEWWEHPEADPYAVLELLPGASIEEASAARRHIARRCHPDVTQLRGERREWALRHMIAANAAYERLRRALCGVGAD